jgi:hypothetical protein
MAKHTTLLKAFQENIGQWVCGYCNSDSNQPAATFREVKKGGYIFEEPSPNRWGKDIFCKVCNTNRTHYKLLVLEPVFSSKPRITISKADRDRILKLFDNRDAFTGGSITSTAEIDHKTPWTRLEQDIDASQMSNAEIIMHFQLLTREHNLLKDRACNSCKKYNYRPPFFEINFWYQGDENFEGTCEGCGWYDGIKWREMINEKLTNEKEID